MEENNNLSNEKNTPKKSNFIPSYARDEVKKDSKNNNLEGKKKKENKKRRFKSKISIIIIAVLVALIAFLVYIFGIKKTGLIKSSYDSLMEDYGYANLYSNGSSNGSEDVTKLEAIKMVLATTINTDNIDEYLSSDIEEEYPDSKWIYYAKAIGLISESEITNKNYNEKDEYINVIRYYAAAKDKILDKRIDTSKQPSFKDFETYTIDEKNAISDLVYNGIIEDSKSKLDGRRKIKKSEFNRIIIEFVLKYNLVSVDGERININKDKMPSNAKEFPYTLANINKSVYEIPNYVADEKTYKTPIKSYADIKSYYRDFNSIITEYFNNIINVNYEEINEEEFKKVINYNTLYNCSEETIDNYIMYAKENKIKINGEVKVQYPIIYFDGVNYRVRTKLTINVESANDLKNLVLGDENSIYKTGKNEVYIDVPLSYSNVNEDYYICYRNIENMKSGSVVEEKVEEEKEELTEEMKEMLEYQKNLTEEDLNNAIEI